MGSAREPVGSAPAVLVPLGFAVTAASVASGDSLHAGHVPAMGMRTNVMPTLALARAAATTPQACTVTGALLATMGTHGWWLGASVGPAPAPKALGAGGILLLPAIGMVTPSRLCASAERVTQGHGATLVPLGTLGTHQGLVAHADHVSAMGTLTPRTLMPVTPARGNACAAYTTRRGHTVPAASLASMGRLPDRAVSAASATCWARIPSSACLLTSAAVTRAVGSAHASPMSRGLAVTAVPPTSGTLPVAMAASLVPATRAEPEAPPAMSSQDSAAAMLALVGAPVLSVRSCTGETLGCSAGPAIVTLVE